VRRCQGGESADVRLDGVEWEGQSNPALAVPGRDGCGDSVAAAGQTDRAAPPESRTRSAAAGAGEDAAQHLDL